MRRSDGHGLERLVAELEGTLLGTGFTVVANDRVLDADGNQIAEFDVTIQGRVGSTKFKWLIECRDRPSQGPAPGSWIEQLAGRRQRFDFDKVIAVSTTGFSPGATDAASRLNVTLRTVTSVAEISREFGTIEFRMQRRRLELRGEAEFGFPPEALPMALSLGSLITDPEIRHKGQITFLGLRTFIHREYVNNKNIRAPDIDERRELVFNHNGPMELRVGTTILPISTISVPITVEYSFHRTTAVSIRSYGENGDVIGDEISLTSESDDTIVKATVLVTRKTGEVVVVQHYDTDVRYKADAGSRLPPNSGVQPTPTRGCG